MHFEAPYAGDATKTVPSEDAERRRIVALEAERDCRELLARYGFYADHAMAEEWVGLFTADGVMRPRPVDPSTLEFP